MTESQISVPLPSSQPSALERLEAFLAARRAARQPVPDFGAFERELHEIVVGVEREALAEELGRFDVDVPVVLIEGIPHRRVLRCEESYFSAAGELRVARSLYSTRQDDERALCPLELRAGIIEGRWTPQAAKEALWVVAHLTPQEGEDLFRVLGNMAPSKSSLDRLPKQLSARWEQDRERFEAALRAEETLPKEAATVAVSLDGVMVSMKDGERKQKRAQAASDGKHTKGPAGYQEVGCGTLSFYDEAGFRLSTVRLARMPEAKKASLKRALTAELEAVLKQRPDLGVVKLADGANDNWTYLKKLPGASVVDFWHATEHLHDALAAAYGETSVTCRSKFEHFRSILRHDDNGVAKVVRALVHLRGRNPRTKKIAEVLGYFRKHRHKMDYATLAAKGLPIGSGVTEAACKTLATQRLKRSGMHWRHAGGQAILTFRALAQSFRFHRGWTLLADTYKRTVELPLNVLAFNPRRPPSTRASA